MTTLDQKNILFKVPNIRIIPEEIKVGIIGLGHWGPNLVRNFSNHTKAKLTYVSDTSRVSLNRINHLVEDYCLKTLNPSELIRSSNVDAVVIVTPASTHYALVKEALLNKKHVFCEKPLTLSVEQDEELYFLAEKLGLNLMVGYNFIFNRAVQKLKEILDDELMGQIHYLTANRSHLGTIRQDVDVIWDLAPHDISIMNFLLDELPERVSAIGHNPLCSGKSDVAFITLHYPSGIMGQIYVSWLDSIKERKVKVIGSKAMTVFDDLNALEPVKFYEKGVGFDDRFETNFGEFKTLLRDGDIISPKVDLVEPLKIMVDHFIQSILHGKKNLSDASFALNISRTITAAHRSMEKHGAPEKVEY